MNMQKRRTLCQSPTEEQIQVVKIGNLFLCGDVVVNERYVLQRTFSTESHTTANCQTFTVCS